MTSKEIKDDSLSKEAILKKTFLGIVIVAFILCLLLYRHSKLAAGTKFIHLFHQIKQYTTDRPHYFNYITSSPKSTLNSTPFLEYLDTYLNSVSDSHEDLPPLNVNSTDYYQTIDDIKPVKEKYLVYLCDDSAWCGGWGDRQRGLVSLYLLSLVYNRSFGIKMTSPCDLAQFYQPNKINWLIDENLTKNKTFQVIYSIDSVPPKLDKSNVNNEDVIFIQTNMDITGLIQKRYRKKIPKYLLKGSKPAIFREIWQKLMKPTPRLQRRLNDIIFSGNNAGLLVCAHIRIGYSKTMRNDPPRLEVSSTNIVWKFMKKFKNVRKYFVATDNPDVRTFAKQHFGNLYVDTGGTILHIDRQRKNDDACDGFETAILDQLILTKCDILIVSESNFSIRGSMLKTSLKDIYMFDGMQIKPYTPSSSIHLRHSYN